MMATPKSKTKPVSKKLKAVKKPASKKIEKNSRKPKGFVLGKQSEFKIPAAFLAQLNEYCGGGFVLFLVDHRGIPQVHSKCDNPAMAIALQQLGVAYFESNDDMLGMALESLS